jgi:hypothetical protein
VFHNSNKGKQLVYTKKLPVMAYILAIRFDSKHFLENYVFLKFSQIKGHFSHPHTITIRIIICISTSYVWKLEKVIVVFELKNEIISEFNFS